MAKLKDEGKIVAGGLVAAARAAAFIVEASSNDEVSELCASLPLWGLVSWDVTPLESPEHRHAQDRASSA